jgi:thiamine biosynthesis lipoprotein
MIRKYLLKAGGPVLCVFLCISCTARLTSISDTSIALGTYVQLTLVIQRGTEERAQRTLQEAYARIADLEARFDYRYEDGALNKFNRSERMEENEDAALFSLLESSLEYARFTGGYFDPTLLPVVELWGFNRGTPRLPAPEQITEALRYVGYEKVPVSDGVIKKPLWVKFDLSGVAKGRIVDLIKEMLITEGYENFLVNAGGDIYVNGLNREKKKWRIAIQDPVMQNEYSGIIEKTNTAVVTSGDYEQFFFENGVKYSHLFNPKTGYPLSEIHSVTVLSDNTAFADAVATAVFSMGKSAGYAFLVENGLEGFFIYSDAEGKIQTKSTSNFWE